MIRIVAPVYASVVAINISQLTTIIAKFPVVLYRLTALYPASTTGALRSDGWDQFYVGSKDDYSTKPAAGSI